MARSRPRPAMKRSRSRGKRNRAARWRSSEARVAASCGRAGGGESSGTAQTWTSVAASGKAVGGGGHSMIGYGIYRAGRLGPKLERLNRLNRLNGRGKIGLPREELGLNSCRGRRDQDGLLHSGTSLLTSESNCAGLSGLVRKAAAPEN